MLLILLCVNNVVTDGRKLRRGDPFTEHVAGWDPPDCNERKKRVAKKNKTIDKVCGLSYSIQRMYDCVYYTCIYFVELCFSEKGITRCSESTVECPHETIIIINTCSTIINL